MAGEGLVLVTGGTGAIGVPLVESFARDGIPTVAIARSCAGFGPLPGVSFLQGDVERGDTLGLDAEAVRHVRREVTTIVHAAALTRFDAPVDAVRAANVTGTRHLLAFARGCSRLRRVVALSTVYVAGRRTGSILESDLRHGCGFVNAYEASKYEAESLLQEGMRDLPIAVCRLSTAVGDSTSGVVRRPAAIHHAIRFLYHSLLPMIPGTDDSPVDLIATDYAVAAIRHLATRGFEPGETFHICAGDEALGESELIDLIIDAIVRHRPAWRRRAIERPAIVELGTFELFRASIDAVADAGLRASVAVLAPFAPQLAYPKTFDDGVWRRHIGASGIVRPPIRETMDRVVGYLIEHDWARARDARGGVE